MLRVPMPLVHGMSPAHAPTSTDYFALITSVIYTPFVRREIGFDNVSDKVRGGDVGDAGDRPTTVVMLHDRYYGKGFFASSYDRECHP